MCNKIVKKYSGDVGNMNFTNMKNHLIAMIETVASASPKVSQSHFGVLQKDYPNALNWVEEEIAVRDWKALRKAMRNTQDIQQRWNERLERNRIKKSVDDLGKDKMGKKL